MIEIIFGQSSSKSYTRAVDLAKQTASYSFQNEEHHIIWNPKEAGVILPLFHIIESWKSARFIVDGRETKRPTAITAWLMCYEEGRDCFTAGSGWRGNWYPFGCKLVRDLSFWIYAPWLRIGALEPDGSWRFDKSEILRFVSEKTKEYRLCPNNNKEWPDKILAVFPASVNPRKDALWVYQTREGMEAFQSLAMGQDDIRTRTIIGVGPRSEDSAREIMEQVLTLITIKEGL